MRTDTPPWLWWLPPSYGSEASLVGANGTDTCTNGEDRAQANDQFGLCDPSSFLLVLVDRRRADRLLLHGFTEEKGNKFTQTEQVVLARFDGLSRQEAVGARLSGRISPCPDRIRLNSGAMPSIWSSPAAKSAMSLARWGSLSRACTGGASRI
jgi:hypothetical protein